MTRKITINEFLEYFENSDLQEIFSVQNYVVAKRVIEPEVVYVELP